MLRFFSFLIILCMTLSAGVLSPIKQIEASGNVIDMVISQNDLVTGTNAGTLEVYDTNSYEQKLLVAFEEITDFMGDVIKPKVFSVDFHAHSNSYIAVLQASNGSRELLHVKDGVKTKLIDANQKLYISKAKFVDANRVLLALLSNEIILFDIKNRKNLYRFQVNFSHFSDLKLNADKTQAVDGCESGEISVINIEKGVVSKVLKGGNVDNVYKVDIKNGFVLGAGQDRRGIVYDMQDGSYKRFDSSFLIYSGALSPSANKAAFSFGENNDIAVFERESGKLLHTLKGQKSTLNTIVFQDENILFSSSDDKFIMKWELKK